MSPTGSKAVPGAQTAPDTGPESQAGRPDPLRDFYEFEADEYAVTPEAESAWHHRRMLVERLLPRDTGRRILDVGCADGALGKALTQRTGARVVSLDLSGKRVARARSRDARAEPVQGSVYELPLADGSFPLVVCSDLLEHLDDPARAMRELLRVSSRFVVVTVPWAIQIERTLCPHCGKSYFLYGHQHSFGKEGLERLAQESGARVERFEHVIPMFECRRYKWFPPLKWLIWDHFKDSGTLGARIAKGAGE